MCADRWIDESPKHLNTLTCLWLRYTIHIYQHVLLLTVPMYTMLSTRLRTTAPMQGQLQLSSRTW